MSKKITPTLDVLSEFLQKARQRLSDEEADYADLDDMQTLAPEEDMREHDGEEEDEADKWLREHDTGNKDDEGSEEDEYSGSDSDDEEEGGGGGDFGDARLPEYNPDKEDESEDEEPEENKPLYADDYYADAAKPSLATKRLTPAKKPEQPTPKVTEDEQAATTDGYVPANDEEGWDIYRAWQNGEITPEQLAEAFRSGKLNKPTKPTKTEPTEDDWEEDEEEDAPKRERAPREVEDLQPTREELIEMRQYTHPLEQRTRELERLQAAPEEHPVKHHDGRLIEARNLSGADRQQAYTEFQQSPEYQKANRFQRMKMDAKFNSDWIAAHPTHIKDAIAAHGAAHEKGLKAREAFERAKDEKIQHIASGGVQAGAFSYEKGLQHAGSERGEEGGPPSGVKQDAGARFANNNPEFVQDFMAQYNQKTKKFSEGASEESLQDEQRADVSKVLGDHPALRDPEKKAKADAFLGRYMPMIEKASRMVIGKLGLGDMDRKGGIDHGILHEAGMNALIQAINDYDHDHASKAKFTTHFNRKMHGLMQTALQGQLDQVPKEMRQQAKKYEKKKIVENAAPVKHLDPKTGQVLRITQADGKTPYVPPSPKPAAPEPTPAPTPAPKPAAPAPKPLAPKKRSAADIAAGHHPEVQERLKRVAALRNITHAKEQSPEEQEVSMLAPYEEKN